MIMSVEPEKETVADAKRKALKKLSDDRVKHWPNTLQATRDKKESFKVDRLAMVRSSRAPPRRARARACFPPVPPPPRGEIARAAGERTRTHARARAPSLARAQEEKERQEIDRKEAQLQKEMRISAIKRANTILYEQTDKMKNLRSQQMYCDVLADRAEQAEEKRLMKTWDAERERAHHEQMLAQITESEARERAEVEARAAKNREIAEMQQLQLGEYRQLYVRRLQQEKEEAEELLKKAEEDVLEDHERAAERSLKARMQCEEMTLANSHLKGLRSELQQAEAREEAKRKEDLRKQEALNNARMTLEKNRFETRQAIRQRMIDRACEDLARIKNTEEVRLEKQAREKREQEDALEALRAERAARQAAAIDRSRQMQLQLKAEKRRAEREQTAAMVTHWKAKNEAIEKEEAEETARAASRTSRSARRRRRRCTRCARARRARRPRGSRPTSRRSR